MLLLSGDWIDADDLGCFKFLDSAVNLFWVEAQQKCESIGGYLAEPTTARYSTVCGQSVLGRGPAEVRVYRRIPG